MVRRHTLNRRYRLLTPAERAEVLEQNTDMVWYLAKRWGGPWRLDPEQLEDLAAAIRLGFVVAATRFEPDRGFTFGTYATWWGKNAATNWLRVELARGQHVPAHEGFVRVQACGLDDVSAPGLEGEGGPDRWLPDNREPERRFGPGWWEGVTRGMRPQQREAVLLLYRDGKQLREAGAILGITREGVRQRAERGLEWLRRHRPELIDELGA